VSFIYEKPCVSFSSGAQAQLSENFANTYWMWFFTLSLKFARNFCRELAYATELYCRGQAPSLRRPVDEQSDPKEQMLGCPCMICAFDGCPPETTFQALSGQAWTDRRGAPFVPRGCRRLACNLSQTRAIRVIDRMEVAHEQLKSRQGRAMVRLSSGELLLLL